MLMGFLLIGIGVNLFAFDGNSGTETASGTVSAQEVGRLDIDWAAGSITIRTGDVTDIIFTETGDGNTTPMHWQKSGDTLKISFSTKNHLIGINTEGSKDLLIEVPKDWICKKLDLDLAAASLYVENLTITELDFDGASGDCQFGSCTVGSLEMSAASGNVTFSGCLDQMEFEGVSGNLELIAWNCPQSISLEAGSGNLNLFLPTNCGFTAQVNVLSGDFVSDFPTDQIGGRHIYGDGSCRIEVNALSGDISIHQSQEAENCDH